MKVALAQMFCDWGDVKGNLNRSEKYIRQASSKGVDLIIFPETSVHGMWKNHLIRLAAEKPDGGIVKKMRYLAKSYGIAVGFGMAEKTAGKPYNSYVLLDKKGKLVGVYRKNFISILERPYFRKGTKRPIFKLYGLKTGVSICADCHCTDILKGYGKRGVDIVLMPHAWDADPILKGGKIAEWKSEADMVDHFAKGKVVRYRTHNQMLKFFTGALRKKVIEGGFYGLFVNPVGRSHPLIPFVGPGFVMGPNGKVLAKTKSKKETLLITEIDVG